MFDIDTAIRYHLEFADIYEKVSSKCSAIGEENMLKYAAEYRQVAEWLKELKMYREKMYILEE